MYIYIYIILYTLNIARAIKKMSINEIRDLSLKNIV